MVSARQIFEEADFEIGIDLAPGEKQRRKDHDAIDGQIFKLAHQANCFIGGLRRDGGDVNFAGFLRGFAGDFVDAAFFIEIEHRTFADTRARDQSGDPRQGTEMLG